MIFNFFRKSLTQTWLSLSKAQSNDFVQPTTLVQKYATPVVNIHFDLRSEGIKNYLKKWDLNNLTPWNKVRKDRVRKLFDDKPLKE